MDKRVAELVLRKCLGARDGETVLVVTDTIMERLGVEFHRAAVSLGLEASLISMPAREGQGQEPPPAVAEALKHCAVAVLLTSSGLGHTRARQEATERHHVRIAGMPGVDPERLEHLLRIDYDELAARCEEVAKRLEGPHRIRIVSTGGTDLEFAIGNRKVYRDAGRLGEPGAFGHLPCGEVSLAPLEGTAQGTLLIDGSIGGLGVCERPVRIRFESGRAAEISDEALSALLASRGELAFNLAEFGVGLNPHAEVIGNPIEDTKACGTVHLALGHNASMGGVVSVPIHVDLVQMAARVEIDGAVLPERWLRAPRRTTRRLSVRPEAIDLSRSDAYRALFEHSNDAQYVLDLETQRFLEVNASFERLTGYTRDELLGGLVSAPKLIAPESMSTFQNKREARQAHPSDRYDLKMLCRDGQKKSVEISVKRMVMEGRGVVLGAVRDLSAHKRLEQEMWEKIQELGFASNRILALTEKIRRVPELTPKLLSITDESELLRRAAEMLCARDGLGCSAATFYLVRDDALELAYSNAGRTGKRRAKLSSDSRLVRILQGQEPPVVTKQEAVLALKGRERHIGILEVEFHPKEIEVLEGNERALKGYHDLLETLSSVLGLLVENLHLYETVRLQSIVDALTGSYNRRFFDQRLADEIQRAARYGRDLSLMLIDLDRFKEINDTMSHKQGDFVLVETAKLFRNHTREVDFVCRIGGDEFAIIMPETSYESALQKGEQLRLEVAERAFEGVLEPGRPVKLSLSIGVTAFTGDVRTSDDMLRVADESLYAAKRAGRDTVCGALPRAGRTTRRFSTPK
ncbi:MAG: diguanylate cyclase [Planctomycetes bacterium]|nr:diguanylate cyclase [Planctomycetota bacterium]